MLNISGSLDDDDDDDDDGDDKAWIIKKAWQIPLQARAK